MTDINDLRAKGQFQKMGRLRRELKNHNSNCWKRQKTMQQIQEMIYNPSPITSVMECDS